MGTAQPPTVAAGTTVDVVFTVPPEGGWAIFVNPGPNRGPLIVPGDVPPGRRGVLPLKIRIARGGSSSFTGPDEPGWSGN